MEIRFLKIFIHSGVDLVLVANEIFGPGNINTIMNGGHYIRGKRAMSLIAEAITQLLLIEFFNKSDPFKYKVLFKNIEDLMELCKGEIDKVSINVKWEQCNEFIKEFCIDLDKFKNNGLQQSAQFRYWLRFIDELFPVLRDQTQSLREGNWLLYLSAIRRALPLFFAHTNYSHWTPLFYEDCVKLPNTYPELQSEFIEGRFVVRHTGRSGSGVPMDQALEKEYNKTSKASGGIIGITKRKEAVAQWCIIKHEKSQILSYLHDLCLLHQSNEYEHNIHHEFSEITTRKDQECVHQIVTYILE